MLLVGGLAGRFALSGAVADLIGGATYTALVYVLVALAAPAAAPRTVGAAAFLISAAIECFQLTGIPQDLADWWSPIRLVLGTSFAWGDFVAYAVGALLAAWFDRRVATRRTRSEFLPAERDAPRRSA